MDNARIGYTITYDNLVICYKFQCSSLRLKCHDMRVYAMLWYGVCRKCMLEQTV